MQIKIGGTTEQVQERNFKRGDKFPVLVRTKLGSSYQYRIFFSEFVSIITMGDNAGLYVPDTCSVYDKQYVVASAESATLTFTQD